MKKYIKYIFLLLFFKCANDADKNLNISGNVKGLRKGKLYLQKYINDTTLINIDSLKIEGVENFEFNDSLREAQFYFLALKKDETDTTLQKIPFFAEKGKIKINTRLNTFISSAKVDGSKNQILWDEYLMVIRKFNNQNIELVKDYLEKKGEFEFTKRDELFEKKNSLINRKKVLFSLNFAMNNSDKEISAYIGLYELNNISKKYLDSLYSKLNTEIKNSFYGKKLKKKLESLI
ncbi:MAG: DUF4369 domain-containing protein [Flavobacteriaceae bacterium]|tara:strand:+ start:7139 stop:7840 length:702 start_codon:yes stop_codon:yes gene_type:complete